MKLIENFTYSVWKPYSKIKEYVGEELIKKELERPIIEFFNKNLKKNNLSNFKYQNSISKGNRVYDGILYQNNYYSNLDFNRDEIVFLARKYELSYEEVDDNIKLLPSQEYYNSVGRENIDEAPFINFKFLVDNEKKEYLIISFVRYPKDYPERAKDQSAPFLTYIHGIWEDPLLTDKIIEKIKKS